ncbi:hypothetical protein AB0K00_20660 [Dactylosporangium sp. NPDC049525]|uniref:hypothetical protein n=1 Tax=Dactylosporangium sp. NPDC049525 TaxID=3154730 RepID=UPI003413674D
MQRVAVHDNTLFGDLLQQVLRANARWARLLKQVRVDAHGDDRSTNDPPYHLETLI